MLCWVRAGACAAHFVDVGREAVDAGQEGPWPEVVAAAEGVRRGGAHQHKAQQRLAQLLIESCRGQRLKVRDPLALHHSTWLNSSPELLLRAPVTQHKPLDGLPQ